ncbi:SDR family oxidoreductase [Puteibacter caeruleilacunae]|nr:SDR family oxidoreductase [Puteibacter caeruleilacunae]
METILITGVTGFLGSHIARELLNQGHNIIGLKRKHSNLLKCSDFAESINWIDCDDLSKASQSIIEAQPSLLIHSAWSGVKANSRDDWGVQAKNLNFLIDLLSIAKDANIKKVISLGSQAEYGKFEGSVDENYECKPQSAYGAIKLSAMQLLKSYAEQHAMQWYWLRIFSVFGPGEDENWLIPATIKNMIGGKSMKLTGCDQKYDYLFTQDFAKGILSVVKSSSDNSGVYNMSSNNSTVLKDIVQYIENKLAPGKNLLNIGVMPYREGQVMHMEGNSTKFFKTFRFHPEIDLEESLDETIKTYLK